MKQFGTGGSGYMKQPKKTLKAQCQLRRTKCPLSLLMAPIEPYFPHHYTSVHSIA